MSSWANESWANEMKRPVQEDSENWVSARLVPRKGHSVQELKEALEPHACEVRIVTPEMVAYEGGEEWLSAVKPIANIHILPYQRFSPV